MENYFRHFRNDIIGLNQTIDTPVHSNLPLVYADWTASGRNHKRIEDLLLTEIMPLVGNTHTESTATGMAMTEAYASAKQIIKKHVNASQTDVLIPVGSGMTGAVNKLQRILGLKVHEKYKSLIKDQEVPVVFITHMEHHSNQTSWLETIADVVIIPPNKEGLVEPTQLEELLTKYSDRSVKIAAITSCSNVTGIITPYQEIASIMHRSGGYCFVDFACSAPYVDIDMHPDDPLKALDAVFFSPHKFLGGPGSSGILIFNSALYANAVPDNPGGGTVNWTNPWGEHSYIRDIESREDGGTPPFLQTIKAALAIRLKEEMGSDKLIKREREMMDKLFPRLAAIPNLHILAAEHRERLGIISFYIDELHHNMAVKLLNDYFGIQTRGGCSCAGTYGHYLLNVNRKQSKEITDNIDRGDLSLKPGWIRLSIHPVMSDEEIDYIISSIENLAGHFRDWEVNYHSDEHCEMSCNNSSADDQLKLRIRRVFEEMYSVLERT